jgi:hypothetical protein
MDDVLSRAVQLYLGYGSASYPQEDAAAVTEEFGAERGAQILWRAQSVIRDAGDLRPDWKTHSLGSAKEWAEGEMKARYPDLTNGALSALGWAFSYWWK